MWPAPVALLVVTERSTPAIFDELIGVLVLFLFPCLRRVLSCTSCLISCRVFGKKLRVVLLKKCRAARR